jgi:hypothetical protein
MQGEVMKKSKHEHLLTLSLSALMLFGVVSCGSDDDDDDDVIPQQEQEVGIYRATLSSLNSSVSGSPSGEAVVTILGDELTVVVNANGVPQNMQHLQNIFVGSSCPTSAADVNADGFVDLVESLPSTGKILVPLDGSLDDQASGANDYPSASGTGTYVYSENASLSRFLADLRSPDTTPEDPIAKIGAEQPLNLGGRVLIVHGVAPTTSLPGTVASIPGVPASATLPILCGRLERALGGDIGGTTGTTTGGTTGTTTGGTTGTTGGTTGTTTGGTTGTTTGSL